MPILYYVGVTIIVLIVCIIFYKLYKEIIYPTIVEKTTKELEKNPKWIISRLRKPYYGFDNVDIIIVDSPIGRLPRFRLDKHNKNRLQFLISENITTNDIEDIGRLILAGKIKGFYGIWFPEKSLSWLSILNYMLDGGEINIDATEWNEK